MHRRVRSSRQRFQTYLKNLRERQRAGNGAPHPESNGKPHRPRVRSSWELVRQFFRLMKPHRGPVIFAAVYAHDFHHSWTDPARRDQVRD